MKTLSSSFTHLPSRVQRWSWGLVLACGLMLGYYVQQTYFSPKQRQYQLDFGDAQWIEPAEVAPIAYFRKEVFLSVPPAQAWLEVAATDNYEVIVNGRSIGRETSLKTRVAGIYDIKSRLKVGTNVIAVSSSRTSYPGSAQILVRGFIKEPSGKIISLISDDNWRVTSHKGIVEGSEDWTSPLVDEQVWPKARRAEINGKRVPIAWVDTNPLLLQLPSSGSWIMAENAGTEAVFSTSINADHALQETWIQVASSGDVDLLVNGHLVTPAIPSLSTGKQLPHLAVPTASSSQNPEETQSGASANVVEAPAKASASASPSQKPEGTEPAVGIKGSQVLGKTTIPLFEPAVLSAYDVSYWIKKGPNTIVAAVRTEHVPATLFANGFTVGNDGSRERFETSSAWRIGDQTAGNDLAQTQQPIELGKDGLAPWGYLSQDLARRLNQSDLATLVKSCLVISLTTIATAAVWLLVSAIVSDRRREPLAQVMARDALFHGPVVAGLVLLMLPNYDPRFPTNWSFQPKFVIAAIVALLAIRLLHFWASGRSAFGLKSRMVQLRQTDFRAALPYLLLAAIMLLGFGLRYHNLAYMSFDHDEMGLINKSKGIFKLGFPYVVYAGEIRWITTYELVPYAQALSALLFGYSEWSMRLPSCIMGTLCIGVIALMGRRLFNWRVGLFTAFVYACMPLDIRWAQNAFYPSQCQFLTMLTVWFFYEAIRVRPLRHGFLTAASVTFCLTYLSWEGTGFLLPAFLIALMVVRPGEWSWLKEFHLYRCLFCIGAVVVAQYCSRTIAGAPYLMVGSGLSNVAGPSLFFLTPAYSPQFYIDKLWLSENHVFFTIMTFLGLPFCWRQRGFRYVFTVLVMLWFMHTNFLAALSPRYCYYYQPLVILAGTAAAITLYDRLVSLAFRAGNVTVGRVAAHATGLVVLTLLFLQSNESVMKEYTLSSKGDQPTLMTRMNTYKYDYRGAAEYVRNHFRPGDRIIPGIPHVFAWYAGMPGDYSMDTLLGTKTGYNHLLAQPRFIDKFAGLPVVRNITELREIVSPAHRTWVVFAPYANVEKLSSPSVLDYLHQNGRMVFESYRAKVMLVERAKEAKAIARTP
jgi:4-amino-4-deoxy-L-arabinose transferase-like glycosyltransferase